MCFHVQGMCPECDSSFEPYDHFSCVDCEEFVHTECGHVCEGVKFCPPCYGKQVPISNVLFSQSNLFQPPKKVVTLFLTYRLKYGDSNGQPGVLFSQSALFQPPNKVVTLFLTYRLEYGDSNEHVFR
jgi:hypothetical protein